MKFRSVVVAVVAIASAVGLVVVSAPAQAARCVSGAEVRQQVATFVHGLRDDVKSSHARTAVRGAFVQSVRAARGVQADTPQERNALGKQISALATQLKNATNLVERKALIAEIRALQEQKQRGPVTSSDVQELKVHVRAVKTAIIARVNTEREGRQVAAFVHQLMAQFNC
jgi:hypothetical protein